MLWDDIVYVVVLLLCALFGHQYRQLRDVEARQWIGTALGLFASTFVSGWHVVHPIVCTLVNAVIITRLHWKTSHLASFFFSFGYLLLFFRLSEWYGLSEPPGHTNLIMMILVLKMSGLAFELNSAKTFELNAAKTAIVENDEQGVNSPAMKNVSFMDVFHYAFNYSGVLTGPYFRFRTYWDFLHRPFADKADHVKITSFKLKEATIYCILFLITEYFYPASYCNTTEYAQRSYFYRVFYMYPAFFSFRMRLYTGMILSECVCYMSGLGAYPTSCNPTYGLGPRNYKRVEELTKTPEKIKPEDLDFETIHNMYPWKLETCYLVRTAMKLWNTTIQYWMATVVYKRFPYKMLRVPVTLAVSALWHGYAPGYYFTICQVALYLPMEDIYVKFHEATAPGSLIRKFLTVCLWWGRVTCMAYLGMSFQLLEFWSSIQFYNNTYWIGHVSLIVLYVGGLLLKPHILPKGSKNDKPKSHSEKKIE